MRCLIGVICGVLAAAVGCQSSPAPGVAAAKVHVVAKAKAGVAQSIARVPVYDAAPTRAAASGQFERVDYSNLQDIIVWLEPADASARAGGGSSSILTIDLDPRSPHSDVRPTFVGERLRFRNRSAKTISIYSVSDGNEFEFRNIAPGASSDEYTVKSEGQIEILCDPSSPPVATVYAAPSAPVARAASGKTITFNNVAPGDYQVVAWHPRLPGSSQRITLSSGRITQCTLGVGVNSLPRADAP